MIAYALALADSPQKLKANQDLLDSADYDPGMSHIISLHSRNRPFVASRYRSISSRMSGN